jgi:carboxypeptidase D
LHQLSPYPITIFRSPIVILRSGPGKIEATVAYIIDRTLSPLRRRKRLPSCTMAPSLFSSARWHQLAVLCLALFPASIMAEEKPASRYYVRNLPGIPKDSPPVKMHAGHIEITPEHNGNLFFWHFQNRHIANKQRTVIWLNGGPGCSSEDGAMMEIGPYRVKDEKTLTMNEGSWHEFANLLFVDNPVGTGFSYVDTDSYITELDTMADNFITFLTKFFEIFPEYELDDVSTVALLPLRSLR